LTPVSLVLALTPSTSTLVVVVFIVVVVVVAAAFAETRESKGQGIGAILFVVVEGCLQTNTDLRAKTQTEGLEQQQTKAVASSWRQ
jgi:hypothetical protein